jgi:hypothetical protein
MEYGALFLAALAQLTALACILSCRNGRTSKALTQILQQLRKRR